MNRWTGQHRRRKQWVVRHDPLLCGMCSEELRKRIDERRSASANDGHGSSLLPGDPGNDSGSSGDAVRIHPMDDQTLLTTMARQW